MQPPARLAKTSDNFKLWLNQNIVKESRRNRWSNHVDRLTENMNKAYNRPICGFYDSDLTNGGPDPNPNTDLTADHESLSRNDDDDKLKMTISDLTRRIH